MGYKDLNASKSHTWQTPHAVLEVAREILGDPIPLDPATAVDNPTGAAEFYDGTDATGDGLMMPWSSPWWCNSPFGKQLPQWAERAAIAQAPGLMLAPARVDTKWWGRIYETADLIGFWRGRMKFRAPLEGPLQPGQRRPAVTLDPCPFPVQIAVYGGPGSEAERAAFLERAGRVLAPHCNGFACGSDRYAMPSWRPLFPKP